jgi:hypothetical protein
MGGGRGEGSEGIGVSGNPTKTGEEVSGIPLTGLLGRDNVPARKCSEALSLQKTGDFPQAVQKENTTTVPPNQ